MKNPKWFWAMKKANAVLIWDSFSFTNFNSAKFFEIQQNAGSYKIVKGDIYFNQETINDIREEIRKKISEDINYPAKIAKKIYCTEKSVLSNIDKLTKKDLKKCSNEELCKIFSKCYNEVSILEIPMSYRGTVQLSDVLTEMIKQELAKKLNQQNKLELFDEYFLLLSMLKKDSYMNLAQKELLRLVSLKQKGEESKFSKELKKHTERFSWMSCVMFVGLPLTKEHFLEEINKKLDQDCKAQLEEINKEKKEKEEKIQALISSLDFSDKTKVILDHLREWYYLRTYAKDCISKAISKTMSVLLEIADRKGLTYGQVQYLRAKEVEDIFNIAKEELIERVNERKKGWGAVVTRNDVIYYTGKDINKIEEKEEIEKDVKVIKGQTASKGIIKGRVRHVKDATELDKVKKGDILVTTMTTTDFTPVLDRISGLITDEGGLTCHAAIVSRELGIPCIIGTRHATKILKDDEEIELDADKGIVRKL